MADRAMAAVGGSTVSTRTALRARDITGAAAPAGEPEEVATICLFLPPPTRPC
jgi:hypothetical protein